LGAKIKKFIIMESSEKVWKDSLKKSYSNALTTATQGSTGEMLSDMNKYSKEMREEKDSDKPVENKITKSDVSKVTAKQQFARDLQDDPDFQDFKKNAKYEKGGSTFTFGVPNVSTEDPYIKKRTKYGRPGRGKEENKEATTSGSSGAFSAPLFGGDDDFVKKSDSETPSLKEGMFSDGMYGVDKIEAKEATTSGSVGGYSSPSMWAKSTSKKDWGPSRKTQYKGGSFVKVKKKCTRFPYCNQGDINALKLTKTESVKEAIKKVSQKLNISEDIIETIIQKEYVKTSKRHK
jgi:hypothetical protein